LRVDRSDTGGCVFPVFAEPDGATIMSTVKNPNEKKRLSLTRDHRTFAEYPKGHRNSWPRAKAGINRQFRRAAKIALVGGTEIDTDEAALSETMTAIRRPKRWPVLPLAQAISDRRETRSNRKFGKVRRRATWAAEAELAQPQKRAAMAAAARSKRAKRLKRRHDPR